MMMLQHCDTVCTLNNSCWKMSQCCSWHWLRAFIKIYLCFSN